MEQPTPSKPATDPTVARLLRWLPLAMAGHLFVGVPALLISLVVAYGTYVQAGATQRMQQAAAWPFVAYDTSNYDSDGTHRINLTLTNNGVGPAVMGPVALTYGGRAVRTAEELLVACCGYRVGETIQMRIMPASNIVLRPGETVPFLDVRNNARVVERLDRERWRIGVRACYCSIFDDCWTIAGAQARPVAVRACPTGWTPYRDR